jgi:hypothetical protein
VARDFARSADRGAHSNARTTVHVTAAPSKEVARDVTGNGLTAGVVSIVECTARKAVLDDSAVAATAGSPVVSLDAFGRAVCVLNEALP